MIKLGGKFKGGGSDGYLVNQPRLSEVKGYRVSSEFKLRKVDQEKQKKV